MKSKRSYGRRSRYRPYIRAGFRLASNLAGRYVGYKMRQMTSSRRTDGVGVTDQYDKKTVYRKKRMPRRMRKRWSKKKRGFDSMLLKRLATKTVVINGTATNFWTDSSQRSCIVHLYGKNGTDRGSAEIGTDDVWTVASNDPITNEQIEKICFESAVLDFTVSNTGESTLEFDVYEFYAGGLRNHITNNWGSDQGIAQSVTPVMGGTGVPLDLDSRGVTPFEFPLMGKYGWKILKKTKFLISPGKAFTYQYRDPRNRFISGTDIFRSTLGSDLSMKGATRSFLFLAKSVVGSGETDQSAFQVGATRVYRYKVIESNTVQSENLS